MTHRCVVFDLDGVLVMSEHLWEQGWHSVAADRGYSWLPDDTRTCQGKSVPEWARYLGDRTGLDPRTAADDVIGKVAAAYDRGEVPLITGALELVQSAAARVPVALASSAPREIIDRVMTATPIGAYFGATVSSAEVAAGKPAPDVYREAIARLGARSSGSLAVEDSSNGVRAAAAAGLQVLGMEHHQYPIDADAASRTVGIYHALDEVTAVLVRLLDGSAE
ncbi:HAD family hydrolase [Mycobacterium antarcticum]|uniref:HAD family hydrolase n=1 Tax=Mycolicibacterium sp. TUM20984 TaxID=3023368 RepID=UPI00238A6C56|nr:HAD family phosphatase [Mycolicibacterium sp. TUM20984]GLP79289.1 haloacid dehalogenase [Mycolicibacterium sp. TUM20984]